MLNFSNAFRTVLVLAGTCLFGCATIISGTSQVVSIDCNVEGADVTIEGNRVGITPYSGRVHRKKESVATLRKEGYGAQTIVLTTSYNPVALLSIVWDFSTTDFLTGAVWEYAPNSYYVNLKPSAMEETSFRQQSAAKAFAMTYYGDLQVELVNGDGPLVRSLHSAYFGDRELESLIQTLRGLSGADSVEFGESVGSLLSA